MISGSNEQLQQELEYTLQMLSGREDTLEEGYALQFCFKLGKNATKTYGMLQTAFAWIGHQFLSGIRDSRKVRESVRDDERCGMSKEVRTAELIGQIKNFMDKDHRVPVETISAQFDVSVGIVPNYSRVTEDTEDLREVYPMDAQRRPGRKTLSWQQGDGRAEQFRSRSSWCSGDLQWKLDDPDTKRKSSQWKYAGSPRPKKARQNKSTHKLSIIPFFDNTGVIYMH